MTRKVAIELCAQTEIIKLVVLQTPDWNGGSYPEVFIKTPEYDAIPEELQDYQYCKFCGDAQEIISKRNQAIDGFRNSNLTEINPGMDYSITVGDAIIMAAYKYLY